MAMERLKKIGRFIRRLMIIIVVLIASIFTPIFAEIGSFSLRLFEYLTLDSTNNPSAIVVVGGGLTKKNGDIVLNHYSQSRAETVIALAKTQPNLPIVTSGAESPWLAEYIKTALPHAIIISDNASMNTCENAVFSAKLMNHHELPLEVYLVSDRYHMARVRRQFAKAGIASTPYPAPLAIAQTWDNPANNYTHSRRTVYETIALLRDIFRPQHNCRSENDISIETIETPRKQPKIFAHLN